MVTLTDTVYEDLVTIAEHIEVSEGGLERFFDGMDEAQRRTAAITALLDGPRPVTVRDPEATLSANASYRTEHLTFLRKDWRAAANHGGTDLGYQDWVADQVERGTTGWLDAEAMRKLKPGTRVVAQVHETVETGTDRCALTVYPGDILRVLDIETRGGCLQVIIRVDAADEEYEEVVTEFDDEERGGLFPFSRPRVTRFDPPWPGDRLFDATARGDDPPDLTIAALHDDQSGLTRGFYRVLDQRGGVHLCGRHGDQWAISRDGQRVHDPALHVALKILGRKQR